MRWLILSLFAALAVTSAACSDQGIGRKCVNPTDAGISGVQIVSPALECQSRLCFLNESPARTICTATCDTDEDCESGVTSKAGGDGLCPSKFVCAVATVAGPFCCKKICLCQDDLMKGYNADDTGAPTTPSSCKPNSGSTCINL